MLLLSVLVLHALCNFELIEWHCLEVERHIHVVSFSSFCNCFVLGAISLEMCPRLVMAHAYAWLKPRRFNLLAKTNLTRARPARLTDSALEIL